MTNKELLEERGYKLVPRDHFESEVVVPGLRERASEYKGSWVLFDPWDDADELVNDWWQGLAE